MFIIISIIVTVLYYTVLVAANIKLRAAQAVQQSLIEWMNEYGLLYHELHHGHEAYVYNLYS